MTVEITGVCGSEAWTFFRELSRHIQHESGKSLAHQYLLQRITVAVQWGTQRCWAHPPQTTSFKLIYIHIPYLGACWCTVNIIVIDFLMTLHTSTIFIH